MLHHKLSKVLLWRLMAIDVKRINYMYTSLYILSNIDRFISCVSPNLEDFYHLATYLLLMYYSFECKGQNMVLLLRTSSVLTG